jgi:hypothetical protein
MSGQFRVYERKRTPTWLDGLSTFRFRLALRAGAVAVLGLVVAAGLCAAGTWITRAASG